MRLPLIVGNWKMNTTPSQAEAIARDLVSRLTGVHNLEVAVAPPFTSLPAAAGVFHGTLVRLAAQDLHWEDRGPYTGAISHFMLDAMASLLSSPLLTRSEINSRKACRRNQSSANSNRVTFLADKSVTRPNSVRR